jgi:hypothetical protein
MQELEMEERLWELENRVDDAVAFTTVVAKAANANLWNLLERGVAAMWHIVTLPLSVTLQMLGVVALSISQVFTQSSSRKVVGVTGLEDFGRQRRINSGPSSTISIGR